MITLDYIENEIQSIINLYDDLPDEILDRLYKLMTVRHYMEDGKDVEAVEAVQTDIIETVTAEEADRWVKSMVASDGSGKGEHWTASQTGALLRQKGYACDPIEFYAVMNMMYNDYVKVARRFGANNAEFYAAMADAFLHDDDAVPDKVAVYYKHIAK